MALNYIWIGFFLIAFAIGLIRLIFLGDTEVFPAMINSTFEMAKTGFNISLGLTGVLALWMGFMNIGEQGGIVAIFSKLLGPVFRRLFPDLGKEHPAHSSIAMNISANMLGLDNAATPTGLKAMTQMQETNPNKNIASNPMIMFLVLNTSGLTLIPVSIMTYRAEAGAANPADIFIPIMLATYFSTLAGLIAVSIYQKINLFNKVIFSFLISITAFVFGIIWFMSKLDKNAIEILSTTASALILFTIIISFFILAIRKKVNIYEAFIEGAKNGFSIAIKIIPYLVAILVAVGVFRESGAMDFLVSGMAVFFDFININSDFVPALPTAFMKPLSGGAARGMMLEVYKQYGPESFPALVASVIQGVTDTTFYIIAVYFGAVGIKKTRYAITCGLIADFVGIVAAIFIAYLFFH